MNAPELLKCTIRAGVVALPPLAHGSPAFAQNTFTNSAPISIPSTGNAIPYPSTIVVSGLTPPGNITNVVVTLQGLTHPRVSDLDIVLVGPGGRHCILRSDAGGDVPTSATTVTFSRTGRPLANLDAVPSGTFAPVNFGGTLENFSPPGPGLVSNIDLGVYDGTSAVGTWSLFIIDDSSSPSTTTGSLAGWTIRFNDPIHDVTQSGTEFTYQGFLKRDGAPFTGLADLRFTLWNDATSTLPGSQFGTSIQRLNVAVSAGVFTVPLDFGVGVFSEKQRFMQVESKVSPETAFTPILPRTPITGVPFSGNTPLAKAATRLDAPDGSPTNVVEVDNFGFARVNSLMIISSNLEVGLGLSVAGGITLPATSRSRMYHSSAWLPGSSTLSCALGTNDLLVGTSASQALTFFLPLDVPDAAIIREVTIFCEDLSTTNNLTCTLRKALNDGTASTPIASRTTVGSSRATSLTLTGLNETADAATAAYSVVATWTVPNPTSQIRVGNVRVKYDITSPLP